ncbi:carboxypeptidase regulatory-like domain-containing protein [Candidatus Methanomassiliicoccus intestinalis]|uniref:carboxypeptidase regulatory-like domain-containing protein n=1 Tax=Candidatus Methanomassiliicoccus intestinalis TaxID=1406512 RepID=UPI0037DC120A
MRKIAVVATALLAILLVSTLMPCILATSDSSSDGTVLGANDKGDEPPLTGKGTVSGRVLIREIGAYDCKVTFTEMNDNNEMGVEHSITIPKENDGYYSIELDIGRYTAYAEYDKEKNVPPDDRSPIIVVEEGSDIKDVNFRFEMSYPFHGTITFEGSGLGGVTVTLTPISGNPTSVQTNEDGYYSFKGLSGGIYTIDCQKSGFETVTNNIDMSKEYYFNTPMTRSGLPGINGFIEGYDFQHSMMVVSLIGMVTMIIFALGVRFHLMKHPHLILNDEEESDLKND